MSAKSLAPKLGNARNPVSETDITIKGAHKTYQDERDEFGPHKAVDFEVKLNPSSTATLSEVLVELLGEADANRLMTELNRIGPITIDFERVAPIYHKVTLFLDSNNKATDYGCSKEGDITSQEEDFDNAGLRLAPDVSAIIVCAAAVSEARKAGVNLAVDHDTWKSNELYDKKLVCQEVYILLSKLKERVQGWNGGINSITRTLDIRGPNMENPGCLNGRWKSNSLGGEYALGADPTVESPSED